MVWRIERIDVLAMQSHNVIILQDTLEINSPGKMSLLSTYIKCHFHKLHAVKDQYMILFMAHMSSSPVTPEVKGGVIWVSMHAWAHLARLMSALSSAPAKTGQAPISALPLGI